MPIGELASKFGAAMRGFWWALDERERRILLGAGVWVCVIGLELLAASSARRRRDELVDQAVAELERRHASR